MNLGPYRWHLNVPEICNKKKMTTEFVFEIEKMADDPRKMM